MATKSNELNLTSKQRKLAELLANPDLSLIHISAEFVCKYFHKGQVVAVQGSIQTRSYTDKDGNKRKAFEVVAESVHFAESKKDKSNEPIVTIPRNDDFEEIISDDDLPFN